MIILGLNAFHADSAACLVRDGTLVAAAEEERFRRVKHWAGFPSEAIRYCLREAGIGIDQVDHIAVNQNNRAHLARKIAYVLANRPDPRFIFERLRNRKARTGISEQLSASFGAVHLSAKVHAIEHHTAHLSSAFHVSPFDVATAVSVDGFGDFSSGAWGVGKGRDIEIEGQVFFPHSLGIFYQAITQYLGFWHYGDEYKVMGLAPYGEPAVIDAMRGIVLLQPDGSYRLDLDYFRHHRDAIGFQWREGVPTFGAIFSDRLERLLGPPRQADEPLTQTHKDIARSAQAMYEEAFFHLLSALHKRHRLPNIAIAGGCGMNSVANGKIRRRTPYENVYVQSAAGDAGGAIGAALTVWHRLAQRPERFVMSHSQWGPSFSRGEIKSVIDSNLARLEQGNCRIDEIASEPDLCTRTAAAIAEGKVIGWFQGRMEWGPRALGNRSILGDPRRADMKEILNSKIKRRESFRPFAPSILREQVSKWFEEDGDVPFMMQVFQIRQERRAGIPAVCHVDGSGRLQTVSADANPRYWNLIDAFFRQTGVPMVLNTSFNENEPVVCRPEEALDCFLRTRMDILVLGDFYISRSG